MDRSAACQLQPQPAPASRPMRLRLGTTTPALGPGRAPVESGVCDAQASECLSIITAGPCRSELNESRGPASISRASLLASLLDGLSHYFVILSWDAICLLPYM